MSILIVEDNPINAKLLQHNLTLAGYVTLWAENGRQALECLHNNGDIQLVISDIMMPEMDGLEFLGRLKEQAEWKDLPVIMCTSRSDLETVKKAVQEGCQSYIVKPIQTDQLMQKVRAVIGCEKAILEDRNHVMTELGLSEKAYEDILAAFVELVDNTIAILEQPSHDGSPTGLEIDLQNLTERADLLGAQKVSALLERLVDMSNASSTKTRTAALRQLLTELKKLKNSLQKL
jgi:CheY-like chemotaxis protein